MQPDNQNSGQGGTPLSKQWQSNNSPSQEAAANIVRSQIDDIFSNNTTNATSQQEYSTQNTYKRTHKTYVAPQEEQWKQYHTAWQNYYKKYYEGYYTHHLNRAKEKLEEQLTNTKIGTTNNEGLYSKQEPVMQISGNEALSDLRSKLIVNAQKTTEKIRKSRHFKPIFAGVIVVIVLLFAQYNRIVISNVLAYISPGSINPQNIIVDPNTDIAVSPEPKLIIPKINVDVPVVYDIGSDSASQLKAMENGVAHFSAPGASSHPGQIGNTVIAGHSSNDLLDYGDYKFIFVQLEKLEVGDTIYANYQSKRYTYVVTKKEVVKPNQVDKLVYPTTKPILTLITCTPIGTAINRLLVTAEQVSPDPNKSIAAPATNNKETAPMPGNSPTLFERIFGIK